MDAEYREIRANHRKQFDTCFWCGHKIEDGEMIALACFDGHGNDVLCQACEKTKDVKMRITPDNIISLAENEVFVFGSNLSGRHGKGAAKTAIRWGAEYGVAEGLQGRTYAIPTVNHSISRSLSLDEIKPYVERFIVFAKENPGYKFMVTEIGCGLAGKKVDEIAPLFRNAVGIQNIFLPARFWKIINMPVS